ncbi:MAG TPA: undecaprenyl-diphosphate phosphatase [Armatimonadota bacterium]
MTPLIAITMGVVQGLTEFLPISSTAHLILLPWLFGWAEPSHTFDVALHAGTLVAVIWYFRRDWVDLAKRRDPLLLLIVVACVPAAIAGKLLNDKVEDMVRLQEHPHMALLVAFLVAFAGLILWAADKYGRKTRKMETITAVDAVVIGVGQALALAPGVSRSGATISTGLLLGLSREAAARFSFLLSTPIIFGAVALKGATLRHAHLPPGELRFMALGVLASAVAGYASIHVLMEYVKSKNLNIFVIYRYLLAAGIVAAYLLKVR